MKFLVAVATFIATIALTTQSIAADTGAAHGSGQESSHGSGHGNLVEKMNSLYPTKMPNAELGTQPSSVEIKSPAFLGNVGAGPVKLEWTAAKDATDYHVQVATDPNFKWLVVNEKFIKENSYNFTAEAGKRYYWRVASFKGNNTESHTKSNFVSSAFNVK